MESTEQERAEFEAVASDYGACPKATERDAKGNYLLMHTATGWMWWQAARRAPVVQELNEPVELTDTDVARIWRAHSGAQRFDGYEREFAQRISDFRDDQWRLAAAPQPPEPAPAHMPEPQAEIEVRSMKTYLDLSIHEWRDALHDGAYKVYTEQQVRTLLSNHGIK